MNNAVSEKQSKATMEKVETAPQGAPEEATGKAPTPQAPELFIDTEGIGRIDNYLKVVGQSEEAGIVDYKSAFHGLVQKLRENVKQ